MTDTEQLLTPAEAGRVLGLTAAGVTNHDDVLQPFRTVTGRRVYLQSRVAALAAERAERRAAKLAAVTP